VYSVVKHIAIIAYRVNIPPRVIVKSELRRTLISKRLIKSYDGENQQNGLRLHSFLLIRR